MPSSRAPASRPVMKSACCSIEVITLPSGEGLPGPATMNRLGKPETLVLPRSRVQAGRGQLDDRAGGDVDQLDVRAVLLVDGRRAEPGRAADGVPGRPADQGQSGSLRVGVTAAVTEEGTRPCSKGYTQRRPRRSVMTARWILTCSASTAPGWPTRGSGG